MTTCESVRDHLPEWAAGELPAPRSEEIAQHLEECVLCAELADTVQRLRAVRPEAPAGLEDRIRSRVREAADEGVEPLLSVDPPAGASRAGFGRRRGGWRLGRFAPVAAVLVLALGTGLVWDRLVREGGTPPTAEMGLELVDAAALEDVEAVSATPWGADDAAVAGAPVLAGLSDDELQQLLEEW